MLLNIFKRKKIVCHRERERERKHSCCYCFTFRNNGRKGSKLWIKPLMTCHAPSTGCMYNVYCIQWTSCVIIALILQDITIWYVFEASYDNSCAAIFRLIFKHRVMTKAKLGRRVNMDIQKFKVL